MVVAVDFFVANDKFLSSCSQTILKENIWTLCIYIELQFVAYIFFLHNFFYCSSQRKQQTNTTRDRAGKYVELCVINSHSSIAMARTCVWRMCLHEFESKREMH